MTNPISYNNIVKLRRLQLTPQLEHDRLDILSNTIVGKTTRDALRNIGAVAINRTVDECTEVQTTAGTRKRNRI